MNYSMLILRPPWVQREAKQSTEGLAEKESQIKSLKTKLQIYLNCLANYNEGLKYAL